MDHGMNTRMLARAHARARAHTHTQRNTYMHCPFDCCQAAGHLLLLRGFQMTEALKGLRKVPRTSEGMHGTRTKWISRWRAHNRMRME
eukprot:1159398-Pelagomonas_calceolata.AAC.14